MIAQISVLALDALLLATLIYLGVLTRRLKAFQNYKQDMRSIVDDVILATESARNAVAKLKTAVMESHSRTAQQFDEARKIESELETRLASASQLLAELKKVEAGSIQKSRTASEGVASMSTPSASLNDSTAGAKSDGGMSTRSSSVETSRHDEPVATELSRRLESISDAVLKLRTKIAANP